MAAELAIIVSARNQSKGMFRQLKGDLDDVNKAAGRTKSAFADIRNIALGNLAASGIKAVAGSIVGLGSAMVGTAMEAADLNAQISGIIALAGGGAGDVEKLKSLISDIAIDPNLVVSGTEAAGIIQELIANGLTLEDVMGGAARETVLLANSTGASFTTAATVASDTMAIFEIKAENMRDAVNGITSVVNASKFDIEDYALALSQGGGVAAAVGVSLDDFNATMTALSSSMASGSDAGTSYKTMLTRLIPQSAEAKDVMFDLGLITLDYAAAAENLSKVLGEDVAANGAEVYKAFVKMSKGMGITNPQKLKKEWASFQTMFEDSAFFDANGQLEDMGDIVGALNEAFAGLTEQQKLNAAETIAGTDGMRAILGLSKMTEEEFRQLMVTMGQTDALVSAGIRTDNLKGDMALFAGTLEDVRLGIGDKLDPALRTLYQSANTVLSRLSPLIKDSAEVFGGIVAGWAESLAAGVTTFMDEFERVGGGVEGVLVGLGMSESTVDTLFAVVGGIQAVASAIKDFVTTGDTEGLKEIFASIKKSMEDIKLPEFSEVWDAAKIKITTAINEVDWTVPQKAIDDLVDAVGDKLEVINWSALAEDAGRAYENLKTTISTELAKIDWADLGGRALSLFTGLKTAVQDQLTKIDWSSMANRAGALFLPLKTFVGEKIGAIDWSTIPGDVLAKIQTGATALKGAIIGAILEFEWTIDPAQVTELQSGLASVTPLVDQIFGEGGIVPTVSSTITDSMLAISDRLAGMDGKKIGEDFSGIVETATSLALSFSDMQIEGATSKAQSIIDLGTSVLDFLADFGTGLDVTTIGTAVGDFALNFSAKLGEVLGDPELVGLGESIGKFAGMIVTKIGEFFATPGMGEDLGTAAGGAISSLTKAAANLATGIINELGKVDFSLLTDGIQSFATGFVSGVATALQTVDMQPIEDALSQAVANQFANLDIDFGMGNTADWLNKKAEEWGFNDVFGGLRPGEAEDTRMMAEQVPPFPGWTELIKWPQIDWPGWTQFIKWPSINWPGFGYFIKFPQISWPGWRDIIRFPSIPSFPGWLELWQRVVGGAPAGNALGSSYFRGGMSWVGESGPELAWLPRGSRIYSHNESMAMAGAGGGVNVVINATLSSDLDVETLAYRVADVIRRRR